MRAHYGTLAPTQPRGARTGAPSRAQNITATALCWRYTSARKGTRAGEAAQAGRGHEGGGTHDATIARKRSCPAAQPPPHIMRHEHGYQNTRRRQPYPCPTLVS